MQTNKKYKTFIMIFVIPILFLSFSQILAANQKDARIIDGLIANERQYPYAVAFFFNTTEGRHFCGGSLIKDNWILTASHCLQGALDFTVYLGTNRIDEITTDAVLVDTNTYYIYPTYNATTLEDDIGLIFLPTPVTFSENIRRVELPTERLGVNVDTIAVGWGITQDTEMYPSSVLRHVPLNTISNAVCRRTYGDFIKEGMICLAGTGNQGICDGDSGSALVQVTPEGKSIQVGIASFYSAYGCENEHPSGFTRTFEYLDWIREVAGSFEEPDPEEPGPEEPGPEEPGTEKPGPGETGAATAAFLFFPVLVLSFVISLLFLFT